MIPPGLIQTVVEHDDRVDAAHGQAQVEPVAALESCSPLEAVVERRVVIERRRVREVGNRPRNQIALGGMEVAARRVDPQGPASVSRLLPCRQGEGIVEQLRHARPVHRAGLGRAGTEDPVVERLRCRRDLIQQ